MQNGEKLSIPIVMVNSFSVNGCEFDKVQLYKNGKITKQMVFMELVCKSDDVTLYRYGHCKARCPKTKQRVHNYYLYKGKDLHLSTTNINLPIAFRETEILHGYK